MERCLFDSKNLQSEISKTCTLAYRCSTDSDTTKGKKKKKNHQPQKPNKTPNKTTHKKKPHTPTKPPKQPPPKTNQPPPPKKTTTKNQSKPPPQTPEIHYAYFMQRKRFLNSGFHWLFFVILYTQLLTEMND